MSRELMDTVERPYLKKKVPEFRVGNTVDVACRIIEGGRQRSQVFGGVVIARKGHGINEMFTVRRIVNNEGVERVFMLHSPLIANVEVKRRGKIRRAKLYYLRDRVGKARRLRERRVSSGKRAARAAAKAASAENTAEAEQSPEPINA